MSQERAIELAKEEASFEPCAEEQCVQIRFVPRGIPRHGFWAIVLSDDLDDDGNPNRTESFLVDVETGDVSRP